MFDVDTDIDIDHVDGHMGGTSHSFLSCFCESSRVTALIFRRSFFFLSDISILGEHTG